MTEGKELRLSSREVGTAGEAFVGILVGIHLKPLHLLQNCVSDTAGGCTTASGYLSSSA